MRVLIIADASFHAREHELLSRLEVGLVNEGVRVVRAVPRSVADQHPGANRDGVFARSLVYDDRGPAFLRRLRDRTFAAEVARLREPEDDRAVDIVHVFGGGAWETAAEASAAIGSALAVEVWSAGLVGRAARARWPASGDRASVLFMAPDRPIESRLREEVERPGLGAVRLAPWGVHASAAPRAAESPDCTRSVMIGGGGGDAASYEAALAGLAAPGPQSSLLIFADADAVKRAGVWPVVGRLGLGDRFTLTPGIEARRELTLRCDFLLIPEALGEHRSLTLDAMGCGTLVVAAADPMIGYLAEGVTARLVDRPSADRWASVVSSLLAGPEAAESLAASAREHVRQNRRASAHIASVMDAYEWLTAGDAIPFSGPGQVR